MLTAERSVSLCHIQSGVSEQLNTAAGVLSIAKQVTSLGRESSIAEKNGVEIVFANSCPHPRVSLVRNTALGPLVVQHIDVHPHAFTLHHNDPAYAVTGMAALAVHLIRRQHIFDGSSRHPLPIPLRASHWIECAPIAQSHTRDWRAPAGDWRAAAGDWRAQTKSACIAPGEPCRVVAGIDKYTAFFMFNCNMVSRLTAYFTSSGLSHARGVCLNMALAGNMHADPACVVCAETLTQAGISTENLQALKTLRSSRPCGAVQCRGEGDIRFRRSVYNAGGLGMGFVMFANGGTPVVVGLGAAALPAGVGPAPTPRVDSLEAMAVDVLLRHAETPDTVARRESKRKYYDTHAARLGAEQRAVLLALCEEDSAGVFGMAAELAFAPAEGEKASVWLYDAVCEKPAPAPRGRGAYGAPRVKPDAAVPEVIVAT